jgi:hypothetical protein
MLTGLCGGGLMLAYQKSASAAQPHHHPSFCCSNSKPMRVVGIRCGDIKSEAKESERIPADRLGVANLEQTFVLIAKQVLLHFTHGVAWQLSDHKTLLRNFEVRQL